MNTYPWGEMPPIKIYNSIAKHDEVFPPVGEHPEVSIYVCGPTTYQFVHVGNMRGPVFFDVVRRVLRAHGYRDRFVTNFTDLDDKIIDEAKKTGEADPIQWSARFVHEYYTDLFSLGVEPANFYPKVTCHIPEIIAYIQKIIDNGHGYVGGDGSVYFSVASFPGYLKLSGRNLDDLLDESRQDETAVAKRDSRDFALWKIAKPGEPKWPSPWGDGRPGWHIECSVMSSTYLGNTFDIHGGGQELRFPHHENERAQSLCFDPSSEFARIWMHYEWVTIDGAKMAKSGKSLRIRDVLKDHDPEVVRLFLLSAHYRKPVDFTHEKLEELVKAKEKITGTFRRLVDFLRWRAEERHENWLMIWKHHDQKHKYDVVTFVKNISGGVAVQELIDMGPTPAERLVDSVRVGLYNAHRMLADDFNTQGPVGELFLLMNRINAYLGEMSPDSTDDFDAANIALGAMVSLSELLGILKAERASLYSTEEARIDIEKGGGDASKLADVLLALRADARSEKNYALSDKIRDMLLEAGAEVRDTKDGAKIEWK
jgi:cysteinyl-tRNA synthetase